MKVEAQDHDVVKSFSIDYPADYSIVLWLVPPLIDEREITGVNYNIFGISRNAIKKILTSVFFLHKCKAKGTIKGASRSFLSIIEKQNIQFPTSWHRHVKNPNFLIYN